MQFGSTKKEEAPDEGMVIAKKVRDQTATVAGLSTQLQIQAQQIKHLTERLDALMGIYQTLQNRFDTFEKQRVAELQARLGNGPTVTGD